MCALRESYRNGEIEKKDIKINHDTRTQSAASRNRANNNCYESAGREIIGQAICAQQGGWGNHTPLLLTINNPINAAV